MWNENSIKTCQDSVLHHTARLLCPTKNGNFSEFLLPRNSFLCISLAMPSEEFSKYILNRSTGSTAVNKCWFLTRKWLVLRPWLVKANAFFIFINGTSPNLVQKHLITWIYPPPTWDSWHVPGGFPQQFKQKIHGPLHDSATTVCVHLVHIHREFFLSISYDLTQGHRQNAKTHLFQRQNSSPIHSEESLFEKKKVASKTPTTWTTWTTSTRPKSSTLFFHSLSTTSPTFTFFFKETFRPTPSKNLHISSISTTSTTNLIDWSRPPSDWGADLCRGRTWRTTPLVLSSFVEPRRGGPPALWHLEPSEDDSTGVGSFWTVVKMKVNRWALLGLLVIIYWSKIVPPPTPHTHIWRHQNKTSEICVLQLEYIDIFPPTLITNFQFPAISINF